MKRRRAVRNTSLVSVPNATKLGILGAVPDATAMVTIAAQAAAAQQHVTSQGVVNCTSYGQESGLPSATLRTAQKSPHRGLTLQEQQDPSQQLSSQVVHLRATVPNQVGQHTGPVATTSVCNASAVPNVQAPYAQHLPSIGQQLQHIQTIGHPGCYNYLPILRSDVNTSNPSWTSMAVPTSLGMVCAQSSWILPMSQIPTHGVLQHATTTTACLPENSVQHVVRDSFLLHPSSHLSTLLHQSSSGQQATQSLSPQLNGILAGASADGFTQQIQARLSTESTAQHLAPDDQSFRGSPDVPHLSKSLQQQPTSGTPGLCPKPDPHAVDNQVAG